MIPKAGEYWNLLATLQVSWDGRPPYMYEQRIIVAKCIGNGVFIGPALNRFGKTVYGRNGYSYTLLSKWEPNWFWKLLGYK